MLLENWAGSAAVSPKWPGGSTEDAVHRCAWVSALTGGHSSASQPKPNHCLVKRAWPSRVPRMRLTLALAPAAGRIPPPTEQDDLAVTQAGWSKCNDSTICGRPARQRGGHGAGAARMENSRAARQRPAVRHRATGNRRQPRAAALGYRVCVVGRRGSDGGASLRTPFERGQRHG